MKSLKQKKFEIARKLSLRDFHVQTPSGRRLIHAHYYGARRRRDLLFVTIRRDGSHAISRRVHSTVREVTPMARRTAFQALVATAREKGA